MLAGLRPRLTYANVMVTLLMFVVLGGSAYALSGGEVKSHHLDARAVTAPKVANRAIAPRALRNHAIRAPKVATDAVRSRHLADGAVGLQHLAAREGGATAGTITVPGGLCQRRQTLTNQVTPGALVAPLITSGPADFYAPVVVARPDGVGGAVAEVLVCNTSDEEVSGPTVIQNRVIG